MVLLGPTDSAVEPNRPTISVHPVYEPNPQGTETPAIVDYQVTNQLRVKIRDLKILGAVLDEVVTKGANQIHKYQVRGGRTGIGSQVKWADR